MCITSFRVLKIDMHYVIHVSHIDKHIIQNESVVVMKKQN